MYKKSNKNNEKSFGSFFILPKSLIYDPDYRSLSCESKMLYGLMLDRSGLSLKNQKTDEKGNPYVYFTVREVMETLSCASQKAVKIIKELERTGLVERLKTQKGKAAKFLVREAKPYLKSKNSLNDNQNNTCENFTNEVFCKSKGNNTDFNNTFLNNPLLTGEEAIKENIEYDYLITVKPKEEVDNIVSIICDALSSQVKNVHIGDCVYSAETVKKRLLDLDEEHIIYVLDTISRSKNEIRDVRSYVLKLLFNAPATMSLYYSAKVSADFSS